MVVSNGTDGSISVQIALQPAGPGGASACSPGCVTDVGAADGTVFVDGKVATAGTEIISCLDIDIGS
eukprot:COSAG01_NODE_28756_length_653_cov_2.070397_1_plen_67_part_00